jgi:TolB-like protein/Tfp pilus assembly protein PilF
VLPAIIYRRQTARSSRQAVAGSSAHIQSIAVLPFNLLGDGAADVYLAQGMADTLIARLSGIRDLKVRPTSAVLKYTNTAYDPFAAGRALKADAVLEGSIHKVGDRIRVTARLLNVKDESTIWASNYTENFSDLLLMQDRISEQVAEALAVRLGSSERQLLTKHHTENVEAYQLYTKGRFFWNKRTEDGFWKAVKYFAQAIALDPDYGLAYCGLADAYALLSNHAYIPPKDGYGKGKDAAIKALEIDDALAEAHTSLAYILHNYDWDWAGAEREFRRAIELNPNYATAHHWYAIYLSKMGQHEEAIAEIKLAQQIDPTSVGIAYQVASIFYRARQYDQAIEHARQAMEIDAGFGRSTLSLAYEKKGMYREALAEMQKAAANNSDTPSNIAHLGRALAMAGRESEARQSLDRLDVLSAQRYVSPFLKARIHAALGEKDRAFDLIEKAYQERSDFMADILVDPREDNLRSDPRFQQLLRRLGLVH